MSVCLLACTPVSTVQSHMPIKLASRVVARFSPSPVASLLGASLFKKQQWLLYVGTDRDRRPLSAAVTSDRPPQLERPQREHWHFVASLT